jgi:hypothetical protein
MDNSLEQLTVDALLAKVRELSGADVRASDAAAKEQQAAGCWAESTWTERERTKACVIQTQRAHRKDR